MFKHILIAVDGSHHSDKAISLALRAAEGSPAARLSALLVVPDYGVADYAKATFVMPPNAPSLREVLSAQGRDRLTRLLARYGEPAERIVALVRIGDRPFEAIVETAAAEHCDLIVMASRGHGAVAGALLGSQTQRVLSLAKVPVLVAP